MNVETVKRLSSNNKFQNLNGRVNARPASTRKIKHTYKNADLNLNRNNNLKDFNKSKSQFDKYS